MSEQPLVFDPYLNTCHREESEQAMTPAPPEGEDHPDAPG